MPGPASRPAIRVDHLARRFESLTAVNDLSFEVAAGEIFGFLGPTGAGKSTTITMLCTVLRHTSGATSVNGYDVVREPALV